MAERAFVEGTISDDDREFDIGYLLYAYGCNTIAELYNPHEFDFETRTRFLQWIQRQVAPVKEASNLNATAGEASHGLGSVNATPTSITTTSHDEASLVKEAFWDDAFLVHHNIRAMYTAWEVEGGIVG
jgi:hypothetical protein